MAATLEGALKAYLEGLTLGVPVFTDFTDAGVDRYIIIHGAISTQPELDGQDTGMNHGVTEWVQVSLWQPLKTPGQALGKTAEVYATDQALTRAFRPFQLNTVYGTPPLRIFGGQLLNRRRIPDRANGKVQIAYTVLVRHEV